MGLIHRVALIFVAFTGTPLLVPYSKAAQQPINIRTGGDGVEEWDIPVTLPVSVQIPTDEPKKDSSQTVLEFSNAVGKCPRRCVCERNAKTHELNVNCGHSKLTTIPDIPSDVNQLALNNNLLSIIETNQFYKLINLTDLDLSNNRISTLRKDAFNGLSKLQSLSLQSNILKYRDAVPLHVFKPLQRLSTLHTYNNCKTREDCRPLEAEITTLVNLQVLSIDGYHGMRFAESFRKLKQLRHVGFGVTEGRCDMNEITNQTFLGLDQAPLESVQLSDCGIKAVEPGAFSMLRHLRCLYLSENYELCHGGWRNVTTGLDLTPIEVLLLNKNCVNLHLDNHVIRETDLGPLFTTNLTSLDMHHCGLQVIEPDVIARALPRSLQRLILNQNDLNNAAFLLFLAWLPNLEYLDISSQSRFVDDDGTSDLVTVGKFDIWKGQLGNGCDPPLIDTLRLPDRLKVINGSYLNIAYDIPPLTFSVNNSLEVLDASKCFLSRICGKIAGLHQLKHLNFSGNRINYIGYDAFSDMPMLDELNLSDNPFGSMFTDDDSAVLFQNLAKLTVLDLSSTMIKRLPMLLFSGLKNLRVLKLRNNALDTLQFKIDAFLQTLKLFDVSNNSIKYLPTFVMDDLDRIVESSYFVLLLSNNKLSCDCQHQSFTKWLIATKIRIRGRTNITCWTQNSSIITLGDLQHVQGQLVLDCVTWLILTVCISFFLCSITFLSLATALYHQRWKLRYLYYASLKRVNPYMVVEGQNAEKHGVYISFDEDHVLKDGTRLYETVSVKLIGALGHHGFRARIREDLSVGKSLNSEISSIIQKSNKVVVFLSRDYCKEFWNIFEFNMAAYDGMYTNRKVLVPVLVEDVESADLLPDVKAYLQKETVILFNEGDTEEFVNQLCKEISK